MEPAKTIIERLGGEAAVAKIAGVHPTTPYCWQAPKEKRGTEGRIPHKYVPVLLAHAKVNKIDLKLEDFFPPPPDPGEPPEQSGTAAPPTAVPTKALGAAA